MSERDGAAVGIDMRRVVCEPELASDCQRLRCERLVELDDVDLVEGSFSRPSSLRVAGTGPMPMIRGATPATAAPTIRARGLRP